MKKALYSALLILSALILSSCRGLPGRDGIDGRDGKDGLGIVKTILVDVPQNSWKYSFHDNNNYFYATVDMPEITEEIFDKGLVKMYRVFKFDKTDASQIEMPYVKLQEWTPDEGLHWYSFTEVVSYEYFIGNMTIFYTASDFDYELEGSDFIPEAMQFRCVIMY